MSVIPLYILMSEIEFLSGLTQDAYKTVNKWLGHLLGGLPMATSNCLSFRVQPCMVWSFNSNNDGNGDDNTSYKF